MSRSVFYLLKQTMGRALLGGQGKKGAPLVRGDQWESGA